MKTSRIVLIAVLCYVLLMAAGVTAYFVLDSHKGDEAPAQVQETAKEEKPAPQEIPKETAQERQKKAAETARENRIEELKSHMQEKQRGDMTYYTYGYSDQPAPGVYLRPFIIETGGDVLLKHDVYYYYTINDPAGTNWIFGDHLDITADGVTETEAFDPSKLHKFMAVNAESLSENYVLTADKAIVEQLKRAGNARKTVIRYYKRGEKERYHTLTAEEKKRIRETVELYELMKAEKDM